MTDGPDFTDPSPLGGISMQVMLHLEKVQRGENIFTNTCEAYRLIFGIEPELSRPTDEIFEEIQAVLSALGPSYIAPAKPTAAVPNERGAVARAAGLAPGPRSITPSAKLVRLTTDTAVPAKTERKRPGWFMVLLAYIVGTGRHIGDWGDFGRSMLWLVIAVLWATIMVLGVNAAERLLQARRARRT